MTYEAFAVLLERDAETRREEAQAEMRAMTIAVCNGYSIATSPTARDSWESKQPAAVSRGTSGTSATLERLAGHLGASVVRRKDN